MASSSPTASGQRTRPDLRTRLGPPIEVPEYLEGRVASIQQRERLLLLLAAAFIALSLLALVLARNRSIDVTGESGVPPREAMILMLWAAAMLIAHLLLNRARPMRDPILLPVFGLLTGWGLVLIDRLAPGLAGRQVAWTVISVGGVIVIAIMPGDLRWLNRFRYSWAILGLVVLGLTLLFGVNPSGAGERLWLGGPWIYFQPSELMKALLIVFLASYLSEYRLLLVPPEGHPAWYRTLLLYGGPTLIMWGLSMVILLWQRDLGAAWLFFMLFACMLYLATGEVRVLLAGGVLLALAGWVAYHLFDVVQLRVDTWWNPWPEAQGRAFQLVQSLYAVAAGGLIGQGIGQGVPTVIPVVHSDFVFSAIAEEYGLMGSLAIIALFVVLVYRGLRVAIASRHSFHALLAGGIAANFGLQALIIIAGTTKLIPLTGVTLPFVSYGGSSLLINSLLLGLLIQMSAYEYQL